MKRFHGNTIAMLVGVKNKEEIRQLAQASLDTMSDLNTSLADVQNLSALVSGLQSDLQAATERIRTLEARPGVLG